MSGVIKAVVGSVAVIVGLAFGQAWLVKVGAVLLLNAAAEALGPKPPRAPPLSGIDIAYSGTLEPRRLIYGQMKVSGMHGLPPLTSGNNNDYFHQILCLAGRPVTAITDVYFNQIRIASANIGGIAGTLNDGLVSRIPTPPAGTVNGNGFNNKAWIRRYTGTQTTVDFILNQTFAAWDANHKGQDIAYLALQFQFDQNVYSSGVPQVTAMVQGHAVYDPRLDSTIGGSGSQRYSVPGTWTYSTNPALILRDYLTAALGLSEAQTRIDDTLVAAAANTCDQTVSVPIPVLVGLTNWTNGSAIVSGNNSAFTAALAVNGYVKAPNGSMLQVLSIQSDVQFTLTAAYGGVTAAGQVTQYNNAGTTVTVTQPRYTCNTALDCTARYEDNIATLAGAMMGHCIYSGGKWRMYAGAWPGSSFALTEDDLVGNVTMQCTTPRKDLFNAVRGNFIDPQQNYQPSEFSPVLNAGYVAQDGGETIYVETNFPCCSDRYEAQRNAIFLSRQSRNRHVVTAQYGMSAYGVKVWEAGTVTLAEIGWIQQSVRCTSWRFLPQGVVELTLQEAYAADWNDPLATDYAVVGINVGPAPGAYLPYPPTGLTTLSLPGAIQFNVTVPSQVLPGTTIELWEYTANTPFSSASLVWFGTATTVLLGKSDIVTRYYWARTRGPNNQTSPTFPAVTGVAGVALTPSDSVWMPWVPTGNCAVADTNAMKSVGVAGWDSSIYTVKAYPNCHIVFKANQTTAFLAIGFSEAPTSARDASAIKYGFFLNPNGTWQEVINGAVGGASGVYDLTTVFSILYDGNSVYPTVNGVSVDPHGDASTVGRNYFGDGVFYTPGGGVNTLLFGPTTNIAVNDSAQIGNNAVQNKHVAPGAIDPSTSQVGNKGSIPPTLVGQSFTYSVTTTNITISWGALTLYRDDGTTTPVASGSLSVNGLTAGTGYTFYPFLDDTTGSTNIAFASGAPAVGTPASAYPGSGDVSGAAQMFFRGHVPLNKIAAATVSSGSGGGSGGGGACLHPFTQLKANGREIVAEDLRVGDALPTPHGNGRIISLSRRRCSAWTRVTFHTGQAVTVTADHRFHRATGGEIGAHALKLEDILAAQGDHLAVVALELIRDDTQLVSLELDEPHLYYLGEGGPLCHNLKP